MKHFWCFVIYVASDAPSVWLLPINYGSKSKVNNFDVSIEVCDDVCVFDIAMYDWTILSVVKSFNTFSYRPENIFQAISWQAIQANLSYGPIKRATVHVWQYGTEISALFALIVIDLLASKDKFAAQRVHKIEFVQESITHFMIFVSNDLDAVNNLGFFASYLEDSREITVFKLFCYWRQLLIKTLKFLFYQFDVRRRLL